MRCSACGYDLCPACHWLHPCLTHKEDFGDSPREKQTGSCVSSSNTKPVDTGYFRVAREMHVYIEPFENLSYTVLDTGLGWHYFGDYVYDFQIYCDMLSWDLPEGFVAFNFNHRKALVFEPGRRPSAICPWSGLSYLRAKNGVGIVMEWWGEATYRFSLMEVHRHIGQTIRLQALRKYFSQYSERVHGKVFL